MSGDRVLVVDDTPANLRLLVHILQRRGFVVATATNADETFAAVSSFAPAIILLDLQLPVTDGLTIARQLKASPETKHIPIIAVTAYAMSGDEQRARAAGCDGYVTKPIDTRALPSIVTDSLARARRG